MLTDDPPDALVLCIYPGNDFQPTPPADGFDADGRPLREYFRKPGWGKHLVAWINLHSKFGFFLQRALLSWDAKSLAARPAAEELVDRSANRRERSRMSRPSRRYRSLFRAIDEECRRRGTKLCILVVGPVEELRREGRPESLAPHPGEMADRCSGHRHRDPRPSPAPLGLAGLPLRRPSQ